MDSYDLTKQKTLDALSELARSGTLGPGAWLFMKVKDVVSGPSDVSPAAQAEAAERIIRAGREHGAKRITMKVSKEAGAKIKAFEPKSGATFEMRAGVDGTMDIAIEYK